ncbi:FctA domain-containing protein [Bifidobacterium sp. ESL0745]|uniref:Spy0128 family protein n=1 Tax=Bifidobacterium sp. ESL0745 TaxID=2983226 RepID=UPI0023F8BCAD|nr:FctA domain-containing protein [Bifidobacterium sp. ESL0745]MDF7665489.1 FctA domain-containing protein [Bifidobacterium sp. ESL0745]
MAMGLGVSSASAAQPAAVPESQSSMSSEVAAGSTKIQDSNTGKVGSDSAANSTTIQNRESAATGSAKIQNSESPSGSGKDAGNAVKPQGNGSDDGNKNAVVGKTGAGNSETNNKDTFGGKNVDGSKDAGASKDASSAVKVQGQKTGSAPASDTASSAISPVYPSLKSRDSSVSAQSQRSGNSPLLRYYGEDYAYVSSFTYDSDLPMHDGSAALDSDDNPGHDSSYTNGTVRTNDIVTVNYKFAMQPHDNTDSYQDATLVVKIEVPSSVTIGGMLWATDAAAKDWQERPASSSHGIDTYLIKKYIKHTDTIPNVIPGDGKFYINYKPDSTNKNGTVITPKVSVKLENNDDSRYISNTVASFKVSSGLKSVFANANLDNQSEVGYHDLSHTLHPEKGASVYGYFVDVTNTVTFNTNAIGAYQPQSDENYTATFSRDFDNRNKPSTMDVRYEYLTEVLENNQDSIADHTNPYSIGATSITVTNLRMSDTSEGEGDTASKMHTKYRMFVELNPDLTTPEASSNTVDSWGFSGKVNGTIDMYDGERNSITVTIKKKPEPNLQFATAGCSAQAIPEYSTDRYVSSMCSLNMTYHGDKPPLAVIVTKISKNIDMVDANPHMMTPFVADHSDFYGVQSNGKGLSSAEAASTDISGYHWYANFADAKSHGVVVAKAVFHYDNMYGVSYSPNDLHAETAYTKNASLHVGDTFTVGDFGAVWSLPDLQAVDSSLTEHSAWYSYLSDNVDKMLSSTPSVTTDVCKATNTFKRYQEELRINDRGDVDNYYGVYDIDNGERTSNHLLSIEVPRSSPDITRAFTLKLTLPDSVKLSYQPNSTKFYSHDCYVSSSWGCWDYGEHSFDPMSMDYQFSQSRNSADTATVLTWKFNKSIGEIGNSGHYGIALGVALKIGSVLDPDKDVNNADSLSGISFDLTDDSGTSAHCGGADQKVSKTSQSAIGIEASPINEYNGTVKSQTMFGNFTGTNESSYAVEGLPYDKLNKVRSLRISNTGGSLVDKIYYSNDQSYQCDEWTTHVQFSEATIKSWDTLPVNPDGTVTVPASFNPVVIGIVPPTMSPNSRYNVSIEYNTNRASQTGTFYWYDNLNDSQADYDFVNRTVSGKIWVDVNDDGTFDYGHDEVMSHRSVTLVDDTGNTVRSTLGAPETATTDEDGEYSFSNIPPGSGYSVKTFQVPSNVSLGATGSEYTKPARFGYNHTPYMDLSETFPTVDTMYDSQFHVDDVNLALKASFTVDGSYSLFIRKTLKGRDWRPGDSFDFNFQRTGDYDNDAIPSTVTVTNGDKKDIPIDVSKYPGTGYYTYTVSEASYYEHGITSDSSNYYVAVKITDDLSTFKRAVSVSCKDSDGNPVSVLAFTNTYEAWSVESNRLHFTQKFKNADGTDRPFDGKQFAYTFTCGQEAPDTIYSYEDDITLPTTWFTSAGDYECTLKQENNSFGGVSKDNTVYTVHDHVTDDGMGQLHDTQTTSASPGRTGNYFENVYTPAPVSVTPQSDVKIDSTLSSVSRPVKGNEFDFALTGDTGTEPMPSTTSPGSASHSSNAADGSIGIGVITFTDPGTYTYTFRQTIPSHPDPTLTYDSHTETYSVTVTDNGNGNLVATTPAKTHFVNRFTPAPASFTPTAKVTLTGRNLNRDEFTVVKHDGGVAAAKANDADGSVKFANETYTDLGTHTYTYTETQGSLGGVTYDGKTVTQTVTVTYNPDTHALVARATNDGGGNVPTFNNRYVPTPVSVALIAHKLIRNRGIGTYNLKGNDFTFAMKGVNGTSYDRTASNDAAGRIDLGTISYATAGTREYRVSEMVNSVPGISCDPQTFDVRDVVTDDLQGHLSLTRTGVPVGGITFTNVYDPSSVTYTPSGSVSIGSPDDAKRNPENGEFGFDLLDSSRNRLETKHNDRNGKYQFAGIKFDHGGTYRYIIRQHHCTDDTLTCDTADHTLTVVVADSGGVLTVQSAKYDTDKDTLDMVDKYVPKAAEVTLPADLVLHNMMMENNKYSVRLVGDKANPQGSSAVDGSKYFVDANPVSLRGALGVPDGHAEFGSIRFTHGGVWKYTISNVAGNEEHVMYDNRQYVATVRVKYDSASRSYVASVAYDTKDGKYPVFVDEYIKAGTGETPGSGEAPGSGEKPGNGGVSGNGGLSVLGKIPGAGSLPVNGRIPGGNGLPGNDGIPSGNQNVTASHLDTALATTGSEAVLIALVTAFSLGLGGISIILRRKHADQ